MNWYIAEQLPVIAPEDYDQQLGNGTARDLVVRDHVLRLTYTSAMTWRPSPATWATTALRSFGTKKSAATCALVSTLSIFTFTAFPAMTPNTC